MSADIVYRNVRVAAMAPGPAPYGVIDGAAVAVRGGRVAWLGVTRDLPAAYA